MNIILKKEKLVRFAESILTQKSIRNEISHLLSALSISAEQAIKDYVHYDTDLFSYGNEIYSWTPIQLVLYMHNHLKGSWHIERQKLILNLVSKAKPENMVEIGFGVPTRYIKEYILKTNKKVTLTDINENAFHFADILLKFWSSSYKTNIIFKESNMDDLDFIGCFDLYLFQDSIEHCKKPEQYLKKTVASAPQDSVFIFSLPIAPLIPMHYIAWETVSDAKSWLKSCGLNEIESSVISVNRSVDIFADDLPFSNLIIKCSK